jgi:hypothetical protein
MEDTVDEKGKGNPMKKRPKQSLKKLPTLKMKLISATDFGEVFDYFFDHFGENEEFMNLGESTRNSLLEQALVQAASKMLNTTVIAIPKAFYISIPDYQFIHGAGQMNDALINFFYFEDIDSGMMAMASEKFGDETKLARFSCYILGEKPERKN